MSRSAIIAILRETALFSVKSTEKHLLTQFCLLLENLASLTEIRNCKYFHRGKPLQHHVRVREVKFFNGFLVFVVMVDPAALSLAFRKIQGKSLKRFPSFR